MSNVRFMYTNLWDTLAGVTASGYVSTFPPSYTQHRWLTRTWRSAAVGGQWLKLDQGASPAVAKFVGVRFNNFAAGATIKIQGDPADSWSPPTYEQALTVNNTIMAYYFAADKTYRYWRLSIDDASPSYNEVGRVIISSYFEPSVNALDEYEVEQVDPSILTLSEGGQISSIQKTHFNRRQLAFKGLTAADVASFIAMYLSRGWARDLWVCEDPASPMTTSYYGRIMEGSMKYKHPMAAGSGSNDVYELGLVIEELR